MLQFIIGVFIGGVVGFLVSSVLGTDKSETDEVQSTPGRYEIGDRNA